MRALLLLVVSLGLLLTACGNQCDFFERCNGNIREVCGDGPDQVVNRMVHSFPCAAPNSACVVQDASHASCVLPHLATCTDAFLMRCDADVLVRCSSRIYSDPSAEPLRYEVGVDCAASMLTCSAGMSAMSPPMCAPG